MTEENYLYRTSQIMLRNRFAGMGTWKIPVIPKFEEQPGDFDDLLLIGFDKTRLEDETHLGRMVHFFLYDYKFERVWKEPDRDIERLSRYRAVLSPDFSMYLEMAPVMQLYNTFRNRWCGAYWASKGIRVIPTVNWGDETTFDFCFEGIEKGSVVAVSAYMASAHGNHNDQKEWFLTGYKEMLRRIEPEKIICYNTPFAEMEGNILFVDYDKSSWRYMDTLRCFPKEDLEAFKIGKTYRAEYDTIEPFLIGGGYTPKGSGSVFGGTWRPNPDKPQDMIFFGPANTIQRTFLHLQKGGYWVTAKYGADGRAAVLRHETEHAPGSGHTNPHDHIINWDTPNQHPHPGAPINYYGTIPELKNNLEVKTMDQIISVPSESLQFRSIGDYQQSMRSGAEVVIEWKDIIYGIWSENGVIRITCAEFPEKNHEYHNPNDALEFMLGGDRLRDVITQVTVLDRTI